MGGASVIPQPEDSPCRLFQPGVSASWRRKRPLAGGREGGHPVSDLPLPSPTLPRGMLAAPQLAALRDCASQQLAGF